MLALHPIVRIAVATMTCVAAFLVREVQSGLLLYVVVVVGVATAGVVGPHLRFLAASLPLLASLLVVWGFAAPPFGDVRAGLELALLYWLRICVLGGALQWLLLPLVKAPRHLRAFLARLGLPTWATLLLITPIVFLPEVRRRIERVVEARKAQGLSTRGLKGLRALPALISPLMASLLEAALGRSELWSHRNLLAARVKDDASMTYSTAATILVAFAAPLAVGLSLWI
jgi:energy-coupling factor transporter transmembrane protein EcfT